MSMRDKAQRNRPTVASAATGVVASLGAWIITAASTHVPADVTAALHAAVWVAAGLAGAYAGKVAQRHTWAEDSHIDALAEAHEPEALPKPHLDEPAIAAPEGV